MPPFFLRPIEQALAGVKKVRRGLNDDLLTPPFSPTAESGITRMPELRATPAIPLKTPIPPLAMPRGLEPRATPTPINDYRGNPIQDTGDFRRDQYIREDGMVDESGKLKVKRSGWDMLKNAGLGFLQGAAGNPNNPLAAGLGGAATGGILTAADPLLGREYRFAQTQQPAIEAEMAKARQAEDRARAGRFDEAKLRGLEADTEMTELRAKSFPEQIAAERDVRQKQLEAAEAAKARALREPVPKTSQFKIGVNRQTGQRDYYDPTDPSQRAMFEPYVKEPGEKPLSLDEAEAIRAEQEGPQEQIVGDTMEGRRQMLFERLPPDYQTALGDPASADAETVQKARQMFDQMWNSEYRRVQGEVRGTARRKATAIRSGRKPKVMPAPASSTQSKATVSIDAVRAYVAEKNAAGQKISEQEALQRFRNKGLNVRE